MNAKDYMVHTVVGGMTTDYFGFFCERCKERIDPLEFLGLVQHTPRFKGTCPVCKDTYEFKIQVMKGRHLMMENPDS
jgi:hypothetical protein